MDNRSAATTPARPRVSLGPSFRRTVRRLALRARAGRAPAPPGIRVLTYHLMPEPSRFRAHVQAIRAIADVIDEDDLLAALDDPVRLHRGECRVLLTFDDGYRQHLTGPALRLVEELQIRPTVFVVAAGIDPSLGPPRRLVRAQRDLPRPLVDAAELRAAVAAGWFVGSHTATHWDCASGTADELTREIAGSKGILESCLGAEVRTFAYPWGKRENISPAAVAEVARAGYRAAFTTRRGRVAERPASVFDLPRDVVEDWWGPREIQACLRGALDVFGPRS
jgi:peptidoglycan/xylan/chitin deacetylase (PgdA/CDA1 family)